MDPWKELAALEDCRDAMHVWAELEEKSALMTGDLERKYAVSTTNPFSMKLAIAAGARLTAWVIEIWWHATRR
jgi:hypothetical protein